MFFGPKVSDWWDLMKELRLLRLSWQHLAADPD